MSKQVENFKVGDKVLVQSYYNPIVTEVIEVTARGMVKLKDGYWSAFRQDGKSYLAPQKEKPYIQLISGDEECLLQTSTELSGLLENTSKWYKENWANCFMKEEFSKMVEDLSKALKKFEKAKDKLLESLKPEPVKTETIEKKRRGRPKKGE